MSGLAISGVAKSQVCKPLLSLFCTSIKYFGFKGNVYPICFIFINAATFLRFGMHTEQPKRKISV